MPFAVIVKKYVKWKVFVKILVLTIPIPVTFVTHYHRRTDGQTDGQIYLIASRSKMALPSTIKAYVSFKIFSTKFGQVLSFRIYAF